MDTASFCSLLPELTLSPGEDAVNEDLSQYPLSDSISLHESEPENMDAENKVSTVKNDLQNSEISEGPLSPRSLGDVSVYISDEDFKSDAATQFKTPHNFNSPATSSSAYFSLVENTGQSNSDRCFNTESLKKELKIDEKRRQFSPRKQFFSSSESSTITVKKDPVSVNLQDINVELNSKSEYEVKIEDKSQSGATDEDVIDWSSDHEEDPYTNSCTNEKEKRELNYFNFKDKPRGEPMGSEDILPSTAFPLNKAYTPTYSGYRTTNYDLDDSTSESDKLSGESNDELDMDVKRSYWLRRNIEGSDDNANLPVPQISVDDDSVRPPLVGQSEEINDFALLQIVSSDLRGGEPEVELSSAVDILMDEDGVQHLDAEIRTLDTNGNVYDLEGNRSESILGNHQRVTSPSVMSVSSVASSKRLEWDSGADIGYGGPKVTYGLSTLEKMAIGCSALKKRMEPEGKSSFVKDGPVQTVSLPSPVPNSSAATQKSENSMAIKEDTKDIELKDVFKNVLVLRNNAVRSASLSDLSAKRKQERSNRPHSCSITDINAVSPLVEPTKIISSSSCSAVSTSSSNTVIGMPYVNSQDSAISSSNKFNSDLYNPSGDFTGFNQSNLRGLGDLSATIPDGARIKNTAELDKMRLKTSEQFDEKTLTLYTKNFVDQICVGADEKKKAWLVKKVLEDVGIVSDSSSIGRSTTISTPTSSVSLPLPPPPPAFEDPIASKLVTVPHWNHSFDSGTSRVSSVLEPILGMPNQNVGNSDSSLDTVKEMQQQLASSFEYYDAGKSDRSDHMSFNSSIGNSTRENVAWVKVLKKKKFRDGRNDKFIRHELVNAGNQLDDSSSSDTYNSNRNLLMKFSSLNKPSSLYSSESTTSDYQIGNANSIHTMKRFIRRLEVVDSWHPEGVELVKDLIRKQRKSYMRRLQREVDWLERIEKILAVNSNKPFRVEKESQTNYFTRKNKLEGYKRSNIKITKDFGQSYPTPISTDSELVEEKFIPKLRTSSIGIQTSKSHSNSESINSTSANIFSFQRKSKFAEKERPVVSIPLTKVIGNPTSKFSTVPNKSKEREDTENLNRHSVAWFLPFGNGQPKMLATGRRGIADGERSESPESKSKRAFRNCPVSNDNSLSLQDAFKCLKPRAIKRSEHRQQKIKMETQLRKRTGSGHLLFHLPTQPLFHRVTVPLQISAQHHKPQRRIISHFKMREQTEKVYSVLPEIVEKDELKSRENHYRTNRLMAVMFRKKLQEKVLKGQVSHLNTQKCV